MSVLADRDRAIALALRAVIQKFNDLGIYFRRPARSTRIPDQLKNSGRYPAVDRDRIVSALVTKGAGTHRAVLSLAAQDDGDNAYALARILLENSLILMWLLGGEDWRVRIDTYALHMAAYHARTRELAELYWPEQSLPPRPEALEWLSTELFNDGWSSWARLPMQEGGKLEKKTLERMSYEMTPQGEDGKRRNSLVYDVQPRDAPSEWVDARRLAEGGPQLAEFGIAEHSTA
jgi:hypothetical protein